MEKLLLVAAFALFCAALAAPNDPRVQPWGKAHRRLMLAAAAVTGLAVLL
ncbi:MAG: hypothetical protein Q4E12_03840 [Coriobacteriia bacterium]|nr:hypothetical protein [Coriobacteriia bacterium]